MDFVERLKRITRLALGLDENPDSLPRVDRLALYKARVEACAADGSTVDVTPLDLRIDAAQGVPVTQPFPGAVVVVQAGAIVHLGWTEGDPGKPYVEAYESGAATKIVIPVSSLYLAGEAGAERIVTVTDLASVKAAIAGAAVVANDGGAALKSNILAAWPAAPGSTKVKAQR